ncbi:MAG TPA: hypothetical protein VGC62_11455 [Pseudomonas sp.]|uniref:hypothetical protein n=1 Tax=Pseudomonas sp. TaxID=306 RepID=UPI002EDAB07D
MSTIQQFLRIDPLIKMAASGKKIVVKAALTYLRGSAVFPLDKLSMLFPANVPPFAPSNL